MLTLTIEDFRPQQTCEQPGLPGSSPMCGTCTATCSADPADVDPAELAYHLEISNA